MPRTRASLMSGPTSVPSALGSPIGSRSNTSRQPGDELVGDVLVGDHAAQGRAALAGGSRGGEDDSAPGELEVGRGGHDRGVVAAELEQEAPHAGRHAGATSVPMRSDPVALTSATSGLSTSAWPPRDLAITSRCTAPAHRIPKRRDPPAPGTPSR